MAIKNVFAETNRLEADIVNLSVDDVKAAHEAIAEGRTLLIDLREIQEVVELGTIPGSRHVPRGMLEFWADPASPYFRDFFKEEGDIIVFCAGGGRSVYDTLALLDMGYARVAHLESGFTGWKREGGEILDVSATSKWVRRTAAA